MIYANSMQAIVQNVAKILILGLYTRSAKFPGRGIKNFTRNKKMLPLARTNLFLRICFCLRDI